jgi:hypothetical protein
MHARTVRSEGPPEAYDTMKQVLNDQVIPALEGFPGFQGAYWVGSREAGKGMGFFFYSDADKLKETAERAREMRDATSASAGGSITEVKEHEVVADTGEKVHGGATHMRVTSLAIEDEDRREEAIRQVKEVIIPTARGFKGFLGGFWLRSLDGSTAMGCTLWDSQQNLEASRAMADKLRQSAAPATGSRIAGVEEFEIVARAQTPS